MNKRNKILIAAVFSITMNTANASGIPVIDVAAIAEAARQYLQMKEDYENQLEQLAAITGHSGIGELLNDDFYKDARRYVPDTWDETIEALANGQFPGSAEEMLAVYQEMREFFGILSGEEIFENPDSPNARATDRRQKTNYATFAVSETAFNKSKERIENYEALMEEIENAEDIKAIGDLNARIAAENGVAIADLVRLQSVLLQHMAAIQNQELVKESEYHKMLQFELKPSE